jgi:hypothetical protein
MGVSVAEDTSFTTQKRRQNKNYIIVLLPHGRSSHGFVFWWYYHGLSGTHMHKNLKNAFWYLKSRIHHAR